MGHTKNTKKVTKFHKTKKSTKLHKTKKKYFSTKYCKPKVCNDFSTARKLKSTLAFSL